MFVNEMIADKLNAEAELALAEKLLKQGKENRDVYKQTEWFQGPDGNMYREISDADMQIKENFAENKQTEQTTLGEVIEHDTLFETLPELEDVPIQVQQEGPRGQFIPTAGENGAITVQDGGDLVAVAHEIDHAVAQMLGFPITARGSSPEIAGSYQDYRNNDGEIMAHETGELAGTKRLPQDIPDLLKKEEGKYNPPKSPQGGGGPDDQGDTSSPDVEVDVPSP